MEINIIEFYTTERDDEKQILTGTLHINLPEHQIDIRGVFVSRKKDSWYFSLPKKKAIDEHGNLVQYQIFKFTDPEKQRTFIEVIRRQGKGFIEKKLAEKPLDLPKPQPATQPEAKTASKANPSVTRQPLAQQPPKRTNQKSFSKASNGK